MKQYETMQEAVDNVKPGETVSVSGRKTKNLTFIIDTRILRFQIAWGFIVGAFCNKDVTITGVPDCRIEET